MRPGNDRAVDVDGVAGVGNQHGVARVEDGEAEVGDALLRSNGDNGLGVGVEGDVVARPVPVADGAAEAGQAAGNTVTMGRRLLRRFHELVDDVARSGAVGVAHAEVDDVLAAAAGGDLHLAGDVEDIRGQALNAAELFHGISLQRNRERERTRERECKSRFLTSLRFVQDDTGFIPGIASDGG